MFIEQFYDEGLAHLSYMIGDEEQAIMSYPPLDVNNYLDLARNNKVRINHIFQTHRNEDFVNRSRSLPAPINAPINQEQRIWVSK